MQRNPQGNVAGKPWKGGVELLQRAPPDVFRRGGAAGSRASRAPATSTRSLPGHLFRGARGRAAKDGERGADAAPSLLSQAFRKLNLGEFDRARFRNLLNFY